MVFSFLFSFILCRSLFSSNFSELPIFVFLKYINNFIYRFPVAQSVSAWYLYDSAVAEKCRGCEFEPHLENPLNYLRIQLDN